jgi:diguanylate cyclase (GGDEF)-like protein
MSGVMAADLAHAFHRGLNDFVCEPFSVEELNARIEHLVTVHHERRQLREMALLDKLTGLPNRRQLERDASAASSRAIRERQRLGLIILDVDHFKRINDTFGHGFGDRVLAEVGHTLTGCLRAHDIIGRYGGEEFAMIVPNATPSGMTIVAERLRQHVEGMKLAQEGSHVPVTVSVGSCMWDYPALLRSPELSELVKPADDALYQAKRSGRNRHCAGPTIEE